MTETARAKAETQNHHDIVTLRDYVESRLEAVAKTMEAAERVLEIRLESMNEFRSQLQKERGEYLPRIEHEQLHARVDEDIRDLREAKAKFEAKASMSSVYVSYLFAVLSLLVAVGSLIVSFVQ